MEERAVAVEEPTITITDTVTDERPVKQVKQVKQTVAQEEILSEEQLAALTMKPITDLQLRMETEKVRDLTQIVWMLNNRGGVPLDPIRLITPDGQNAVLVSEAEWLGLCDMLELMSDSKWYKEHCEAANTPLEDCIDEDDFDWD